MFANGCYVEFNFIVKAEAQREALDRDFLWVSKKRLVEAIALLIAILLVPAFPASTLKRFFPLNFYVNIN